MSDEDKRVYKAKGSYPFEDFESPGYRSIDGLKEDTNADKRGTPIVFLFIAVMIGLACAGAMFIFDPTGLMKSMAGEREETEYEKRIKASKLASKIAEELKDNITMPPEPPDPESVVEEAMTESMKNDVDKLMSGVDETMGTTVINKIADRVAKKMEADIKLLSKDIAEGKLSPEEIAKRQKELEDKTHDVMNQEVYTHRVETQTERAEFESIKWYKGSVAPALLTTISQQVFKGGERIRPTFNTLFDGQYGWSKYRKWSRTESDKYVQQMQRSLTMQANEQWNEAEWKKWKAKWKKIEDRNRRQRNPRNIVQIPQAYYGDLNDWVYHQASICADSVKKFYYGTIKDTGTYPSPSWFNVIYGSTDEHMRQGNLYLPTMTNGILNEYLIDDQDRFLDMLDDLTDEWEDCIEFSQGIEERALENAPLEELHKLREERNKQMKSIAQKIGKLLKDEKNKNIDFRTRKTINALLRFRIMADEKIQQQQYNKMIDGMVAGLSKLIKDFARSQFRKGILEDKDGIDAAVEKFQADIVPILTEDLKRKVCSFRYFKESIFNAGSHKKFRDILGEDNFAPERQEDIDKELKALDALLSKHSNLADFVKLREKEIHRHYDEAVNNVVDDVIMKTLIGGWLAKNMEKFVEGVDYSDKVKERLDARESAKVGRKQDMARMTKDGVPDTDVGMTALKLAGQKGHGANLVPVETDMTPLLRADNFPLESLRYSKYIAPKPAKKWNITEPQVPVKEIPFTYKTPIYEGIPFLAELPTFDGDLSEWANLRPLYLKNGGGGKPIAVYAGWNYQGFFFAYQVDTKEEDMILPVNLQKGYAGVGVKKATDMKWAYSGESFRVCFDTIDARDETRGEAHTQEFFVFPLGTNADSTFAGVERVIQSKRDAKSKQFRGVISRPREFRSQGKAPSKYAPFRITKKRKNGYTTEIFIPRTLFNTKVFSPGWMTGFNCMVATGPKGHRGSSGKQWVKTEYTTAADHPDSWGDLVMLGTDPKLMANIVDDKWTQAKHILAGHSLLLTVVDPDRNVYAHLEDQIIVSAEVNGGHNDVEILVLKETGPNTGIFRGIVNTQPGLGREVQGVLELMAGFEVIFGYVDFGNARGEIGNVSRMVLPVVGGLLR